MAVDIRELTTTGTAHPDPDLEKHTVHFPPFGGRSRLDGAPFVARANYSTVSVFEVSVEQEYPLWEAAFTTRLLSAEASADLQQRRDHPNPPPRRPSRVLHVNDSPSIIAPRAPQE